jgi:hypothetical protein
LARALPLEPRHIHMTISTGAQPRVQRLDRPLIHLIQTNRVREPSLAKVERSIEVDHPIGSHNLSGLVRSIRLLHILFPHHIDPPIRHRLNLGAVREVAIPCWGAYQDWLGRPCLPLIHRSIQVDPVIAVGYHLLPDHIQTTHPVGRKAVIHHPKLGGREGCGEPTRLW